MFLPEALFGLGVSFGFGSAAGSTAGSIFGPITFVGGAVLGGVVGLMVKAFSDNKKVKYHLYFEKEEIDRCIQKNAQDKDKNDDAQAPGKPTEEDGFAPKNKWDGKKVKHPKTGQCGWHDEKGNVWVPTGPKGHGGPHWDKIDKKGRRKNIFPGGRER